MYTCTCNGDTDTQHVCMNVLHHKHKHTHKAHMHKKNTHVCNTFLHCTLRRESRRGRVSGHIQEIQGLNMAEQNPNDCFFTEITKLIEEMKEIKKNMEKDSKYQQDKLTKPQENEDSQHDQLPRLPPAQENEDSQHDQRRLPPAQENENSQRDQ